MAGRVREKLAEMLMLELTAKSIDFFPFSGDDLLPVTGYWKSQDCYRWESLGLKARHENGCVVHMTISGWATMTSIVRSGGVNIERAFRGLPYEFEADPIK